MAGFASYALGMPICAQCGEDNPARARFCLACGSPLAASGTGREVRKTVTVVFSDLVGSTPLGERLDPESLREVITRYYDRAAEVLARHGGTVAKFIGDAVMAVYGIPRLHEDDALRAVRGAAELGDALAELNGELEAAWGVRLALRTGVNTGEVVVGDAVHGQEIVVGDAVNVAARLEQAAGPGEVLIGEQTWRLVRDAATVEPVAPLAMKGKSDPVGAFRLLGVRPDMLGHARHLEAAMVGRTVELGLLDTALGTAEAERSCHLVLVLGPAGMGKSRLVQEFLATVEGQGTVLRGRCVEYGEGLTYWPIAEVIRQAAMASGQAGLRDLLKGEEHAAFVVEGLAGMAGTDGQTASREEVPWAVRRLFEALARGRPLIVVVDDLHWADPALLDLLEHVARFASDAPILIVGIARPELLDDRPDWGARSTEVAVMMLEPLGEDECVRLIGNLLGGADVSTETAGSIARAAGGNPLFIEELIAELIDRRLLVRSDHGWEATADLADVPIPAGVSALLAARLDRLDVEERAVLERASVVGQVFDRQAVVALSPEPERPTVGPRLAMLVRRQLLRAEEAGGTADGDAATAGPGRFRFRHLLIRDVSYEALPKRRRAELHERLADWLGREDGEVRPERDEIAGHHFEQAYRYLEQLGRVGPREVELAMRGARRLASGGRRAMSRDDPPAAVNLLSRALDLLPIRRPGPGRLAARPGRRACRGGRVAAGPRGPHRGGRRRQTGRRPPPGHPGHDRPALSGRGDEAARLDRAGRAGGRPGDRAVRAVRRPGRPGPQLAGHRPRLQPPAPVGGTGAGRGAHRRLRPPGRGSTDRDAHPGRDRGQPVSGADAGRGGGGALRAHPRGTRRGAPTDHDGAGQPGAVLRDAGALR